jgi:hypothetical protein
MKGNRMLLMTVLASHALMAGLTLLCFGMAMAVGKGVGSSDKVVGSVSDKDKATRNELVIGLRVVAKKYNDWVGKGKTIQREIAIYLGGKSVGMCNASVLNPDKLWNLLKQKQPEFLAEVFKNAGFVSVPSAQLVNSWIKENAAYIPGFKAAEPRSANGTVRQSPMNRELSLCREVLQRGYKFLSAMKSNKTALETARIFTVRITAISEILNKKK